MVLLPSKFHDDKYILTEARGNHLYKWQNNDPHDYDRGNQRLHNLNLEQIEHNSLKNKKKYSIKCLKKYKEFIFTCDWKKHFLSHPEKIKNREHFESFFNCEKNEFWVKLRHSERSEAKGRVESRKLCWKRRKWMKEKGTTTDRPTTTFFVSPPPPSHLQIWRKVLKSFIFWRKFRNATKIFGRLNYAKKRAFDAVFY